MRGAEKASICVTSPAHAQAPGVNAAAIFGGDAPAVARADPRLRSVPFPTRRPTFTEAKRVARTLLTVYAAAPPAEAPPAAPKARGPGAAASAADRAHVARHTGRAGAHGSVGTLLVGVGDVRRVGRMQADHVLVRLPRLIIRGCDARGGGRGCGAVLPMAAGQGIRRLMSVAADAAGPPSQRAHRLRGQVAAERASRASAAGQAPARAAAEPAAAPPAAPEEPPLHRAARAGDAAQVRPAGSRTHCMRQRGCETELSLASINRGCATCASARVPALEGTH